MIDTHKTSLNDDEQLEEIVISKTSIKKAMFELQDLADELIKTIPKQIAKLPLSEILSREIELGRKLPSGNSRRRQVQRIAWLEALTAMYTKNVLRLCTCVRWSMRSKPFVHDRSCFVSAEGRPSKLCKHRRTTRRKVCR